MKNFYYIILLSCLVNLSGCLSSGAPWEWSHPDPAYAERQRQDDIDVCEQETTDLSTEGPFRTESARPYGGWGDFIFELCMEERGWVLVQRRADRGSKEQ